MLSSGLCYVMMINIDLFFGFVLTCFALGLISSMICCIVILKQWCDSSTRYIW